MAEAEREIVISLISHTNVGKTALARTLLRRDVGEVADSAHITVTPEAYLLLEHDGCRARLWDTPGFGSNLAKLAKRLRSRENPLSWLLRQVWDRHIDHSLWCSQEAIRNVQSESDLVLYLADATQSPETVGYVDLEIEVIQWIGKPVLVFLNQTGHPDPERERANEEEWRAHLSQYEIVKHVDTLDAFTRCWTEEHRILEKAAEVVPREKRRTAETLRDAWVAKNLDIFDRSVAVMARWAADAVTDTERLPESGLSDHLRRLLSRSSRDRELDRVQQAMYDRLASATTEAVNDLIALHGLDGETAAKMAEASRDEFAVKRDVEEPLAATVGGAASGLVGGLSADLLAGGMTFGGGAIVGMLLGGASTYALVKGYNLTRTGGNMVRWTEAHFTNQVKFILMLYLAVSHFGRGRGAWRDPSNNPGQWESVVDRELETTAETWSELWKKGGAGAHREKLEKRLHRQFRKNLVAILTTLYPDSAGIFPGR